MSNDELELSVLLAWHTIRNETNYFLFFIGAGDRMRLRLEQWRSHDSSDGLQLVV